MWSPKFGGIIFPICILRGLLLKVFSALQIISLAIIVQLLLPPHKSSVAHYYLQKTIQTIWHLMLSTQVPKHHSFHIPQGPWKDNQLKRNLSIFWRTSFLFAHLTGALNPFHLEMDMILLPHLVCNSVYYLCGNYYVSYFRFHSGSSNKIPETG